MVFGKIIGTLAVVLDSTKVLDYKKLLIAIACLILLQLKQLIYLIDYYKYWRLEQVIKEEESKEFESRKISPFAIFQEFNTRRLERNNSSIVEIHKVLHGENEFVLKQVVERLNGLLITVVFDFITFVGLLLSGFTFWYIYLAVFAVRFSVYIAFIIFKFYYDKGFILSGRYRQIYWIIQTLGFFVGIIIVCLYIILRNMSIANLTSTPLYLFGQILSEVASFSTSMAYHPITAFGFSIFLIVLFETIESATIDMSQIVVIAIILVGLSLGDTNVILKGMHCKYVNRERWIHKLYSKSLISIQRMLYSKKRFERIQNPVPKIDGSTKILILKSTETEYEFNPRERVVKAVAKEVEKIVYAEDLKAKKINKKSLKEQQEYENYLKLIGSDKESIRQPIGDNYASVP